MSQIEITRKAFLCAKLVPMAKSNLRASYGAITHLIIILFGKEYGNELPGSIKGWIFFTSWKLSNVQQNSCAIYN
jgi:hypothetical protein